MECVQLEANRDLVTLLNLEEETRVPSTRTLCYNSTQCSQIEAVALNFSVSSCRWMIGA